MNRQAVNDVIPEAIELSHTEWKLAFSTGEKIRTVTMDARDLDQLQKAINGSKNRFKIIGEPQIRSCYEAGRDSFWLHRYVLSCGIENVVVDSSSIEVNRRKRQTKTDGVNAVPAAILQPSYARN